MQRIGNSAERALTRATPTTGRRRSAGLLASLAAGALACAAGCDGSSPGVGAADGAGTGGSTIEPFSVAVEPVARADMASSYATSATLRAEKSATVTSRTRGVLEQLLVEEGDHVREGQTIARLEDDEQALAVARFEELEEMKRRELSRLEGLNEQAIVSDNDLELVRREARELKHDLDLARLNLERTTIVAPFDGIVVLRHIDVGATVSDGTAIYDLADVDPLFVDVRIPERHVARLSTGQGVRVDADTLETPVEGRIERLAPVVDATTGTVKVTVAVEGSVALRPGAFVEVAIITEVHEQTLVVPRSALVAEGRLWMLYRVLPDGASVEALEVQLGFEEGDRVEILTGAGDDDSLEGELAEGDHVVVLGASALSDGAPVRVLERGSVTEEPAVEEPDSAPSSL